MSISKTIYESLQDENHKKTVASWPVGDYSSTDHIFGSKGKNFSAKDPEESHRIRIPLEHDDPIKNHLENNGYTNIDYNKVTAVDMHGRETKIGKALVRTQAEPHIIKRFNDDSAKKALGTGSSDHEVVISRHPYDVAGMSTNKRWSSCMSLDDGERNHYLPEEIKHRTHVAYLVKKGDPHGIHNPLARIAIKKYENSEGHEILRPDEPYGAAPGAFQNTVRKWTEDNFKPNPGHLYHQNDHSYDDGAETVAAGDHTHFMKAVKDLTKYDGNSQKDQHKLAFARILAQNIDTKKLTPDDHEHIWNVHRNLKSGLLLSLSRNKTASMEDSYKFGDAAGNMKGFTENHGHKLHGENFDKFVAPHVGLHLTHADGHRNILSQAIFAGAKLSKPQFDSAMEKAHSNPIDTGVLVKSHPEHIEDHHIKSFVDNYNSSAIKSLLGADHKKTAKKTLSLLSGMNHSILESATYAEAAVKNEHFDEADHKKIHDTFIAPYMNFHRDSVLRTVARNTKHMGTMEEISRHLGDDHTQMNPHSPKEKVLDSINEEGVRRYIDHEHLQHQDVRKAMIGNSTNLFHDFASNNGLPHFTKDDLTSVIQKHNHSLIHSIVKNHPNYDPSVHILK